MMPDSVARKILLRWLGWFALANSVIFALISLRYLSGSLTGQSAVTWTYLVSVYVGHHVLLTIVPLFGLTIALVVTYPRKKLLTRISVMLFALMIALTVLDSLLWSQSRFHINALTLRILGWQSWVFTGFIFLIALVFESMLARTTWNWLNQPKQRHGLWVGIICTGMIFLSQLIHAWADASYYVPVTSLGQQLPVYKGVTAKSLMTSLGLVDVNESRERELARKMSREMEAPSERLLKYPLAPLQCQQKEKLNLLIILADAMRADMLSPEVSPSISQFAAARGITFSNHFSGGNSSRMGAFSLFYGLPPGYWGSFAALQQSTVLLDQLQQEQYQLGLFASSTMYRPVMLDRTAFARVPQLRVATEPASDPSWKRDITITEEWIKWLGQRKPERPFFGFLFYDTSTTRNHPPDYPEGFPADGEDFLAREMVRYKKSIHFVDNLAGKVLADLDQRGLMDSTVVIISSDHGEEFGENGAGLEKHGSGYTTYQLKTPMIVHWPGKPSGIRFNHRTSHYDVVPTLMQDLLGCSNPAADYSVGSNLFESHSWDWLVAGSYYNFAVLEPDQITITFPTGLYEVRDWNYQLLEKPKFRGEILEAVSEQNSRYFSD